VRRVACVTVSPEPGRKSRASDAFFGTSRYAPGVLSPSTTVYVKRSAVPPATARRVSRASRQVSSVAFGEGSVETYDA
jgi:hypothetical protein